MNTIITFKIPADLDTPCCPVPVGHKDEDSLHLPDMYAALNCDLVEVVQAAFFPQIALWCDEEALCKGEPELNLRASILAGRSIYGPVLVVSETPDGYSRSWTLDNPLPFKPCGLQELAREISRGHRGGLWPGSGWEAASITHLHQNR